MGQIVLRPKSGRVEDAALALERLVPQDIVALAPGRQRYAQFTNDSGGILDYLGCSVAVSGNTVAAGSFGHNNFQGAAYVASYGRGLERWDGNRLTPVLPDEDARCTTFAPSRVTACKPLAAPTSTRPPASSLRA